MWKLIRLFSLLLLVILSYAQQITREFDVSLELTPRLQEEKPRLNPPDSLPLPSVKELNLTYMLLEAPKSLEFAEVKPIERTGGISCGEPKDALSFRLGVDYYLRGRYKAAEEELSRVISIPNSPFKPMAEYVQGIISYSKGENEKAMGLFESSCKFSHIYQTPACEAFYALHFRLRSSVPENQNRFWRAVAALRAGDETRVSCDGVVFTQYCRYVSDFLEGRENPLYRDSTLLRSAILSYLTGDLKKSREVFNSYASPRKPFRDVAVYYLSLVEFREGKFEEALRLAGILETLNPPLANELYAYLSDRDIYLSRLTYSMTGQKRFLERAGIIAYNARDYRLAFNSFVEAGSIKYAVYSALKLGDYRRVIQLLRDKRDKDGEDYLWLLEALYWSGEDMMPYLLEVDRFYPELYREYQGWERFRRGDWSGAASLFDNPYYKAVAMYNLKNYREVINLLRGRSDRNSNILRARSALMLGDPVLARSFLTEKTDAELYLLGLSYFMVGDYSKATGFFERIPVDSPVAPKAILKSADSYFNIGNTAKARELYYQVLRRFPESPEARQAIPALLDIVGKELNEGEYERLLTEYMSKEKAPPPEMVFQYALLMIKKGNLREAQRQLNRLLDTSLGYRAMLKLAELEQEPSKKIELLRRVFLESKVEEERKSARDELVNIYSAAGDRKGLADLLSSGDNRDRVRALSLYLGLGDTSSALSLANQLIRAGFRDTDFDRQLLELYRQTEEPSLLEHVRRSQDRSLRGQAIYLQGMYWLRRNERRKALESMVDISLNYRGEAYYNSAILEGVKILLEIGANRDASCLLDRFDQSRATQEELSNFSRLKQGLPRCEVR